MGPGPQGEPLGILGVLLEGADLSHVFFGSELILDQFLIIFDILGYLFFFRTDGYVVVNCVVKWLFRAIRPARTPQRKPESIIFATARLRGA